MAVVKEVWQLFVVVVVEVSFDLAKSFIKTSSSHHPTKTRRIKWTRQILNYLLFPTYNEVIYWQEGL